MTATRPTRIALSAAASLAAVGALASCGGGQGDAAASPTAESAGSESPSAPGSESASASGSVSGVSPDNAPASGDYADGTYEATGMYVSPGGQQQVEVALTLADGVVTAVTVTPDAADPRSQGFQEQFASGIDDVVVGVPLDELAVDKVSGSSLTSGGFADAIEQIKVAALA